MRHLTLSLLILVLVAILQVSFVRAQAPTAASERKSFDVATIKPNKSGEMRVSMRLIPGGAYEAFNVTLGAMVRQAYRLQDFQLIGAPAWVDQDRFDIVAKPPAGEPLDLQPRMQSLLAERFNLKAREETREFPVYALVVANPGKLGSKLTRSDGRLRRGRPRSRQRADTDAIDAIARHAAGVRNDEQRRTADGRRLHDGAACQQPVAVRRTDGRRSHRAHRRLRP